MLLNDDEIRTFVRSKSERRDLSAGERAMAVAMLYPQPEKGGRGKKKTVEDTSTLFSTKRLQQARIVLHHSAELAKAVRDDTITLDAALATVKAEQQEMATAETKLAELQVELVLSGFVIGSAVRPKPRLAAVVPNDGQKSRDPFRQLPRPLSYPCRGNLRQRTGEFYPIIAVAAAIRDKSPIIRRRISALLSAEWRKIRSGYVKITLSAFRESP
jgi:hypothetical protein